ncbi:MAG: hypothetical protein QF741_01285 [Candidatus Peribacteraceae bacterium]|jgi:hypothetical protein|nr:hypothetical protein [Candidatus Peribacteraceae bacterium]MDP7453970.1 hypothetical protein [Candidatus Peribacteraceae bacterium]MDP7645617.1 hypothetical protein [Candidatus Peribacteraceae bacterium]
MPKDPHPRHAKIPVSADLVDRAVAGEEDGLLAVRTALVGAEEKKPLLSWSLESSMWCPGTQTLAPIFQASRESPFHAREPVEKSSLDHFLAWLEDFVALAVKCGLKDPVAERHKIFPATDLLTLKVTADRYAVNSRYGGLDPSDINDPNKVIEAIEQAQMPQYRLELALGCSLKPCELPTLVVEAIAHDPGTTALSQVVGQFQAMIAADAS